MKAVKEIKLAVKERDWKWLGAFIAYTVIALAIVGSITFSSVVNSFEAFGILRDNIYSPKKELDYSIKPDSSKRMEDGRYFIIYTLKFSIPQGQTGERLLFNKPDGCDSDNMSALPRGIHFKNDITYSIAEFEITCITAKSLVEDVYHNLFTLR